MVDARNDDDVGVDFGETFVEHARIAIDVHEAVGLPMDVGQFGDDVARNRRMGAKRLDLVFEIGELVPLGGIDEGVERTEYLRQI
jgi:hypothetical protein